VTEVYDCSRAPADARAGMDDGEVWVAWHGQDAGTAGRGLYQDGQRLSPGAADVGQVSDRPSTASRTLPTGNRLSHWRHHGAHIPADMHAVHAAAITSRPSADMGIMYQPTRLRACTYSRARVSLFPSGARLIIQKGSRTGRPGGG
jgi:hypothetical protein